MGDRLITDSEVGILVICTERHTFRHGSQKANAVGMSLHLPSPCTQPTERDDFSVVQCRSIHGSVTVPINCTTCPVDGVYPLGQVMLMLVSNTDSHSAVHCRLVVIIWETVCGKTSSAWFSTYTERLEPEECVVCGSDEHDDEGWIFSIEDNEVVVINGNGLERKLKDDARPICSIECKDEFERQRETGTER